MSLLRSFSQTLALLLLSGSLQAALVTEEVAYQDGDTTLKGYLAYDDAVVGARPGVLVVHEWWGHNAYARKRAELLAGMGYTALAVDMYGEGKTADHPDNAKAFMMAVKQSLPLMQSRFMAAYDFLRGQASVDGSRLGAIGYCFGGGVVLEMARQGLDLKGVASFHGGLAGNTVAEPGKVKAKVLVANGAADPMVTPEMIDAFKAEMAAAGVDLRFYNYEGVKHSFTNPDADAFGERFNMPLAYSAEADKDSWEKLDSFLKEVF
jgi:dienelactone hydrolase